MEVRKVIKADNALNACYNAPDIEVVKVDFTKPILQNEMSATDGM